MFLRLSLQYDAPAIINYKEATYNTMAFEIIWIRPN